ncbi:MAG: glycosyltransferase [Kofleriaceae bacterium]
MLPTNLRTAAHPASAGLSIVHVLSSFGVGGQERVALDLAIGQLARGHVVSVISLAPAPDGPLAAEFAAAGVAVHRVAKRGGIDPTLVPRLALVLRRLGANVVHTHNPLPLIYGAPAARLIGARAIHTKHGVNPGTRAHRLLRRAAAQLAHAFVAVSDTTCEQARAQHDAPLDRLSTIPNGIRLDRYAPDAAARAQVRSELGLGDAFVVGTVGRIDRFKNQALLVRAMGPLLSPEVRLVIVGDGDNRAQVEDAIHELPDPSLVVMTGRRSDVPRVIQAFDVFALPSKSEGLPLVVPEAMSASLPIVATNVGGLPSVVDHMHTGFLVDVDEDQLRAALSMLVNDRERAREMGARARQVALARYSHERMVDDYLALYGGDAVSEPADRSSPSASNRPVLVRLDTSDGGPLSRVPLHIPRAD